ncbi:MAG: hypothetical protein E7609_03740 [Ruminococcaceae bacterium]|nr:hypothetical protein [Oscillospiraceae bacterium]
MSIQKITDTEILENGVKSLPTRPSTPSVYSGKILSAEELKAAFDNLPILIARRFNALLESTGLFDDGDPKESFAELIATELSASHSLKNFFEDVKNGNLALYLTANTEGGSLADVLAELKLAIESKKSYTVSIEGDGDLLSDAHLLGEHLTIKREARKEDIVNEAKAYADAPAGTVSEECTLPVSGNKVFQAIEKANEKQEKRIEALEYAGKDILYTYPTVHENFAYKILTDDVLPHAALLRMGASPLTGLNIFPEPILSTYASDHLTITWDEENGQLVMNGTLYASESPLTISPFPKQIPYDYFSAGVFYHSGSVSTDKASLGLFGTYGNQEFSQTISFLEENSFFKYGYGMNMSLTSVRLETSQDTVFNDYRFNFIVSRAQTNTVYEPFSSGYRFVMPKKLVALGPNLWDGEKELRGEGCVSIVHPLLQKAGNYLLGFCAQTSNDSENLLCVYIYTEDGLLDTIRCLFFSSGTFPISSKKPITEVRVATEDEVGTIILKDMFLCPVPPLYKEGRKCTEPYRDEIVFPDSFSRFSDRYIGFGTSICNHFDFEKGRFYEAVKMFTVDGSLDFEADANVEGRFSATFTVPSDFTSTSTYQPSDIFSAYGSGSYDEKMWFADGRVFLQSALFAGKEASEVKRLLRLCPIDVAYKLKVSKDYALTEEESDFCRTTTLCMTKNNYLYFCDENGEPVDAYSYMQYQIKKTE